MSEPAVPKIKVTDAPNRDGSGAGGTSGVDSPSTTTDGGHSNRPRSATSSEGNANAQSNGKKSPIKLIRNTSNKEPNINGGAASPQQGRASTAIDPLSHHILQRTNTENTIPQKLRNGAGPEAPIIEAPSPTSPDIPSPGRQLTPEIVRSDSNPTKEKKKGVSFLSRFSIIGGKKKDQGEDADDDESELGDPRTEGMNAHVFSSSVGANGFIPQHKEPPRYIKVRAHNKKTREFNRMFLAQELNVPNASANIEKPLRSPTTELAPEGPHKLSKPPKAGGAIWAMEWSKDGRYLAAAGRDQIVRVWAVISTPEERQSHEYDEDLSSGTSGAERLSAPVFRSKPIREFEGHTGEVLDVSWSKNNFLLSSSMDKTVRLWHVSRPECLCTFKHKDFVTSIAFHPTDDRFFLAGSLDSILRLWAIPDKNVAYWQQLPDLITAVAFTPDGKTAIAGTLTGLCFFYDTDGLKYHTQIHVKSSRGKNSKGSKITGIRTATATGDDSETPETRILITSNDSRIRLYNLKDKSLEMKFRGHENTYSQINASFSDDGRYVICGSEDRKAYIWNTLPSDAENKDKPPVEMFSAHSDMVTTAVMAPTATRQLLSGSGDPIYDLCNPPPVTLLSREESNASSIQVGSEKRHLDPVSVELGGKKKIEESPAYLARTTHNDGLIITTADYQGIIKCFRLDCAFEKRHQWDASSTFSKKKGIRSSSIMTKSSVGSARRNSVSQTSLNGTGPHEHILSWRSNIKDGTSSSVISSAQASRSDRSASPGKFNRASYQSQSTTNSQNNPASAARAHPYSGVLPQTASSVSTTSPPPSIHKAPTSLIPTPGFSLYTAKDNDSIDSNPLRLDAAGKSNSFWNMSSWKAGLNREPSKADADSLRPPLDRKRSVISKLSSESGDPDEEEESESELACRKCEGRDFRAKRVPGKGLVMVCTRCGSNVD